MYFALIRDVYLGEKFNLVNLTKANFYNNYLLSPSQIIFVFPDLNLKQKQI